MKSMQTIVILTIVLCTSSALAQGAASSLPKWKSEFQRARQVWDKGEFNRAFAVLEKAYAAAPDNTARAQIAFRYADWSHQLGRYTDARRWYRTCLSLSPPGSDLIRRAREGLSGLPPEQPIPSPMPPPTVVPTPAPRPFSLFTLSVIVFASALLVFVVLLQWISGWKREAFFAQVILSILLAGATALMFPLGVVALTQELQPTPDSWIAGSLTIGGVAFLAFAARSWQQGQLLRGTPLTRLRSASHGFLKVRGTVDAAYGALTSQVGSISAVYLKEVSSRYVRRTESYYDSRAKRWRTRTVYRWETIYFFDQGMNFVLDDGTGKATVEVEGAEFYPESIALFYNYRPVNSYPWFARVGDVRTHVHYIPPGATVTVWARYYEHDLPGTERDEMRLQYDRFHKCMVVLQGHENRVYAGRTLGGLALATLGIVMLLGALYTLLNPATVLEYINHDY